MIRFCSYLTCQISLPKNLLTPNNPKKWPFWLLLPVLIGFCSKNIVNSCLELFLEHFGPKNVKKMKKKNLPENRWFFEKKFQRPKNPHIWAQKSNWMGFPCGFSSKLVELSKKWILEKVYRKCVKFYWHGLLSWYILAWGPKNVIE